MPETVITPEAPKPTPAEERHAALVEEYMLEPPEPALKPALKPATPPTPAPPVSESPAAPKHSRRVLAMAEELGIPKNEVDASTPDELDAAVYHANRALHAERARAFQEASRHQATLPSRDAEAPADDSLGTYRDADGADRPLEEAGMFPEVLAILKGFKREIKQLREQVGYLGGRDQEREAETTSERIDRFFASQDKLTYGEGAGAGMQDGPEYARRVAVLREAERLAGKGASGKGATRGEMLARLGQAARNLFGAAAAAAPPSDAPPAPAARPRDGNGRYTAEQQRWLDGAVERPTHRGNAEEPKGKGRAVKKLTELMNGAGLEVGRDNVLEDELHGELPD